MDDSSSRSSDRQRRSLRRDLTLDTIPFGSASVESLTPAHALAISTDLDLLAVITKVLETDGVSTMTARDNAGAVSLFQQLRPGLVGADMGESPTGCLDALRAMNDVDRHIPVILVSNPEDRETAPGSSRAQTIETGGSLRPR